MILILLKKMHKSRKSIDKQQEIQMSYDPLLCSVNPQCFNCLHFWNTGNTYQKGKCTMPKSPDYKKEVDYSNVCDLFEAV